MAARTGEKSSFAVACNLLSNYIKQKGPIADLGLEIASRPQEITKDETETMELFPQKTGFGTGEDAPKISEPGKGQLTIFYGGKVLVFDNFPAEKAKDLMNLASKGNSTTAQSGPTVQSNKPEPTPVQKQAHPSVPDMPIARKASLHRFLEKRKDRLNARAPYQVSATPVKTISEKKEKEETQAWLGLGQVKPCLSSECGQ